MAHGFGSTATYQFYRTERWLGRLKAIYGGDFQPIGNWDDPLDHVLAFFFNCHHVKDWLMTGPEWQDEVAPKVKKMAVEQFISESEALSICADLCNGNKHFRLDKKPRSGNTPIFHSKHTKIDTTTGSLIIAARYTFRTVRGDTDAYALAEECFEDWRNFIRESTPESLETLASRYPKYHPAGSTTQQSRGRK